MPRKNCSANPSDTYQYFATEEPFRSVAKRLFVSPSTLRLWWVEKFGREAFTARGKALQAKGAVRFGTLSRGQKRSPSKVEGLCISCGAGFTLSSSRKSKLREVVCSSCNDKRRGADRACPVCRLPCVGARGLSAHFVQTKDDAHLKHTREQEELKWVGEIENLDYVKCRVCGFRAASLQTHLRTHGLVAEEYRTKYPEAMVLSPVSASKRSVSVARSHTETPRAGRLKVARCSSCGEPLTVPLTSSSNGLRCPCCQESVQEAYWASLIEGSGYIICQACGYRTEDSLVSHIRNAHPGLEGKYKEVFPGALVVSSTSALRDRSHLQGVPLPLETRLKMSAHAGRWNKGLTKNTDERVLGYAQKMKGRTSWSRGKSKETDPRLQLLSETMTEVRAAKHWTNGAWVSLTREQLLPFALKNGKISIGKAIAALGHAFVTIRRECERHGLGISRTAVLQTICLEAISQVLGGASYLSEWNDPRFTNPSTGRRFRFDGYFPSHCLIVEVHGFQHWTFPSVYIQTEELYFSLQERDRVKENLIHQDSTLRYFVVREDEPYADTDYLRGRLRAEGHI